MIGNPHNACNPISAYRTRTQVKISRQDTYHLRFVNCNMPSLIRNKRRPGVAINTSRFCRRLSSWVLCPKPPVATTERKGTPDLEMARQFFNTCKSCIQVEKKIPKRNRDRESTMGEATKILFWWQRKVSVANNDSHEAFIPNQASLKS